MNYPKLLLSCQTLKQEQLSPVSIPEVAPAVGDLLTGAQRITRWCLLSVAMAGTRRLITLVVLWT